MVGMAKKKKTGSRHKDRHMVSVDGTRYALLRRLSEKNCRFLRWEIIEAIDEHLRKAGLWPPPDKKADEDE